MRFLSLGDEIVRRLPLFHRLNVVVIVLSIREDTSVAAVAKYVGFCVDVTFARRTVICTCTRPVNS